MSNDHVSKMEPIEGRLAEQLKREALAERPAYSPDLHARVMAEISSLGDSIAANEPLPKKRNARSAAAKWAAIAAGLLIVAIGINQLRRAGDDSLLPAHPTNHSTDVATPSKSLPTGFSFDDFNHNAGLAIRLVVDQLPIDIPADDWGLPAVE
jgi:hypothetical protein